MQEILKLPNLPALPDEIHKGNAGRILIIGGSQGYSGSVILAAKACLKAGAGLVTVAVPDLIGDIVEINSLESMTLYCDSKEGRFSQKSHSIILEKANKADAILVGPGMGIHPDHNMLLEMLMDINKPIVIDADGLNNLSLSKLKYRSMPTVLTPHIGEMYRLLKKDHKDATEIPDPNAANTFAERHKLILVLKSHETIVSDGEQYYYEKAGNPGMATGGTGDVLAGTIAAFANHTNFSLTEVCQAVHLHSLAGDLAAKENSQRSLIASDLYTYYAKIFKNKMI